MQPLQGIRTPIKGRDAEFVGDRGGCHGRTAVDAIWTWCWIGFRGGSWVGFMVVVAEMDGVARSKALIPDDMVDLGIARRACSSPSLGGSDYF